MGKSPEMFFRFTQLSTSPSTCSLWLSIDGPAQPPPQLDILLHLEKSDSWGGEGWSTQPSHMWSRSLITNILQEACPRDQITEAVALVLGEAILFLEWCSVKEGLLYRNAQDVEPGWPQGSRRATWSSAAILNVNNWMQDLDKGVSYREVGRADDILHSQIWVR